MTTAANAATTRTAAGMSSSPLKVNSWKNHLTDFTAIPSCAGDDDQAHLLTRLHRASEAVCCCVEVLRVAPLVCGRLFEVMYGRQPWTRKSLDPREEACLERHQRTLARRAREGGSLTA
ncbi:hypothetical protein [Streptomyces collinus]|uniref:hypothetical protein n=1 Tax=Streptomyces collinus TaxID=42684 RepID=UPI00381F8695